jgi:hypothetical protein
MKKLALALLAATALFTATDIVAPTPADAGIVIRFSFGPRRIVRQHATRHSSHTRHYASTRHHRGKSRDPQEASREPDLKTSANSQIVARPSESGSKAFANSVNDMYWQLPAKFREFAGPVLIFTRGTIGDFRRETKNYDAPDALAGLSMRLSEDKLRLNKVSAKTSKAIAETCIINLMENTMVDVNYRRNVLAHEMGHCVDFNNGVTQGQDYLETFFKDVNTNTRKEILDSKVAYYATKPQEAFAQAVAEHLAADTQYDLFKKYFPNLMDWSKSILTRNDIAVVGPTTKCKAEMFAGECS